MELQISRIGLVILLLFGYVPALLARSIPMLVGPIQVEALLPSEYFISVPFYIQTKDYYCGPAALQMIFDYHGKNVSQLEIADAARTVPNVTHKAELRRAAHFSNISTSQGSEMPEIITGYTGRKLGYGAFEKSGMSIEDLKTLIAQDFPVILLMTWEHGQIYGHYRVAVGFNITHIFLHDPWNKSEWGGTYGGPNLALNCSFVDTMWDYSEHWGLIVTPWKLDVRIPNAIPANDRFIVTANVTYVKPAMISVDVYPASSCMAAIALPEGLTLAEDENATKNLKDLQAGETVQTQWTLETTRSGSYSFYISAKGKISGTVPERPEVGSEYSYQDLIGIDSCKTTITVGTSSSPGLGRIEVIVAASITITAIVASGTALYYLRFRRKKQTSINPN